MPDRLHLQPKHREVLEALLREHLPDVEVWAYGSRVSGKSHDGSDLDLVLRGPGLAEIPIGHLGDFEEAVQESTIPFLVEARDWARLPERFHREIERDHVVLVDGGEKTLNGELLVGSDEWRETAIGDLIDITHGFAFKGEYISDEPQGDILLTPGNFAVGGGFKYDKFKYYRGPISDDYILFEGALIVSMTDLSKQSDTLGYPAFVPKNRDGRRYLHNQRLGKVYVLDPDLEDTYIYYVMCGNDYRHEVLASATGTTVKHTSPNRIKQFRFQLAPPSEQRTIAHILGTLDDKIELNRRMNETLEAMSRALFKSWFVDFDPVRAKMEGRDPYLDAEVWDLFPDTLNEEGKPEGWQSTELGDRVTILDAKRIPLSSRERQKRQGPFPYHGAAGVLDHIDDYLFDGVHVLLGEDGSVIRSDGTPYTQYVWGKFWANNHAHVLKGKSISDEMLICFLEQVDIAPFVTGAVQPKLNQKNLKSVPFPPADPRIAACFQRATKPLFAKLRINAEQTQSLTILRDSLLPKLISGDLRLREAERMAGTVA